MAAPSAFPFGAHDYEIQFPQEGPVREVRITAVGAEPLRVGDLYTVGQPGCFYEVTVEEIVLAAGGRWNARCSAGARQWTG